MKPAAVRSTLFLVTFAVLRVLIDFGSDSPPRVVCCGAPHPGSQDGGSSSPSRQSERQHRRGWDSLEPAERWSHARLDRLVVGSGSSILWGSRCARDVAGTAAGTAARLTSSWRTGRLHLISSSQTSETWRGHRRRGAGGVQRCPDETTQQWHAPRDADETRRTARRHPSCRFWSKLCSPGLTEPVGRGPWAAHPCGHGKNKINRMESTE